MNLLGWIRAAMKHLSFALFAAAACVTSATSATLYTSGVSTSVSNQGGVYNIGESDWITQWVAGSFELSSASTVAAISFEGAYTSSTTIATNPAFEVAIFANVGGQVGPLIDTIKSTSLYSIEFVTNLGWDIYRFEANLDIPAELEAGSYWLALNPAGDVQNWGWSYTTDNVGFLAGSSSFPTNWFINPQANSLVFTIEGAAFIPEPSIALLGALGAFGLLRRRRA